MVVPVASGIAAETKAGAVPAKLVGCWQRNVTAADWKRAGTTGFPAGVWVLSIKKNGDLYGFVPDSGGCAGGPPDFVTNVSVAGGRLTIFSVPVCGWKGVYSWKVSGRSLTLRAVADKRCRPRLGLFTGVWKRK